MPPGGKMLPFSVHCGENVLPTGGNNASPTVRTQCVQKSSNNNLSARRQQAFGIFPFCPSLFFLFYDIL